MNDELYSLFVEKLEKNHWLGKQDPIVDQISVLADNNVAYAQYLLGKYHEDMRSDTHNKKALHWYTKAAENGHTLAQFTLGHFLERGKGVFVLFKNNRDEQIKLMTYWYREAAKAGHKEAQFRLAGSSTGFCRGGDISDSESTFWLKLSVFQNHKEAMLELAIRYRDGHKIKQSGSQALCYFSQHDSDEADALIAKMYHFGNGITQDLQQAITYYSKIQDGNRAKSEYAISTIYKELNDNVKAHQFLKKASDAGYHKAQQEFRGYDDEYLMLLHQANNNHGQAHYRIGKLYEEGCEKQSIKQNKLTAVSWYQKALDSGFSKGRYEMGLRYLSGVDGVKQDIAKAIDLFEECIKRKKGYGYRGLALAYEQGLGVEKDQDKAESLREQAKAYYE